MTTEELKAHRRAICEALIDGKQCQYRAISDDIWLEQRPSHIASVLFSSEESAQRIRIKPVTRKAWIGWPKDQLIFPILCATEAEKCRYGSDNFNWQLVTEEVK